MLRVWGSLSCMSPRESQDGDLIEWLHRIIPIARFALL